MTFSLNENESTMNIGGYDSDDHFTINTETPFFPLPQLALDLNEVIEEQLVDGNANNKVISTLAKQIGKIYAPISMFEFYWPFSNEEFFMIKLCWICDKANVPHHIVDDIVNLLRECKKKNLSIKPEYLLQRVHFIKHLEKQFKSPIPQSMVIGLEGFSSNDTEYVWWFRDTAEIIWYDFKEQALDLIHDINIWGDMSNFEGTVDPNNPFSGQSPRTDGLLDEIVDGAWY